MPENNIIIASYHWGKKNYVSRRQQGPNPVLSAIPPPSCISAAQVAEGGVGPGGWLWEGSHQGTHRPCPLTPLRPQSLLAPKMTIWKVNSVEWAGMKGKPQKINKESFNKTLKKMES